MPPSRPGTRIGPSTRSLPAHRYLKPTAGWVDDSTTARLGNPSSFNFATSQDIRTRLVTYLITGTLLEFDYEQLTIEPGVAGQWSLSPDSTTIRIELRKGLRFSDGQPVTAGDVVFSLDRLFQEGSHNATGASLRIEGDPLGYR